MKAKAEVRIVLILEEDGPHGRETHSEEWVALEAEGPPAHQMAKDTYHQLTGQDGDSEWVFKVLRERIARHPMDRLDARVWPILQQLEGWYQERKLLMKRMDSLRHYGHG